MKQFVFLAALFLSTVLSFPNQAFAGDGAKIVLKSGIIIFINNGYQSVIEEMMKLNRNSQDHRIVKLTIEGGTFLLNTAEVVLVCRDRCKSLEVIDTRDPSRGK